MIVNEKKEQKNTETLIEDIYNKINMPEEKYIKESLNAKPLSFLQQVYYVSENKVDGDLLTFCMSTYHAVNLVSYDDILVKIAEENEGTKKNKKIAIERNNNIKISLNKLCYCAETDLYELGEEVYFSKDNDNKKNEYEVLNDNYNNEDEKYNKINISKDKKHIVLLLKSRTNGGYFPVMFNSDERVQAEKEGDKIILYMLPELRKAIEKRMGEENKTVSNEIVTHLCEMLCDYKKEEKEEEKEKEKEK